MGGSRGRLEGEPGREGLPPPSAPQKALRPRVPHTWRLTQVHVPDTDSTPITFIRFCLPGGLPPLPLWTRVDSSCGWVTLGCKSQQTGWHLSQTGGTVPLI